jgi:hypothetical protein|tara:strand:- start:1009 stop:1170 length:162 start_codon:yes stop_codon:yes gene_type:complete
MSELILEARLDAARKAYSVATANTTHNVAEAAWEVYEEARQALIDYKKGKMHE